MNKLWVCFAFCAVLVSCNTSSKVNNEAFPVEYQTLEFWNGGGCIAVYQDVQMEVVMMQSSSLTNHIIFYKYHIYNKEQHIDDYIIDSEALSIKYTLPN